LSLDVVDSEAGATLRVRVKPNASRSAIDAPAAGVLVVRLAAKPAEGAANAALIGLLARALGVPRGAVGIVKGARGRDKLVRFAGLRAEIVRRLLEPTLAVR
jgi:uncharacterized protein